MRPSRILAATAAATMISIAPLGTAASALTVTTTAESETCTIDLTGADFFRGHSGFSRGAFAAAAEFKKLYPLAAPAIDAALRDENNADALIEAFTKHYPDSVEVARAMKEAEEAVVFKRIVEKTLSEAERKKAFENSISDTTPTTKKHLQTRLTKLGNPANGKEYARAFVVDMINNDIEEENISERDLAIIYDSITREMEPALIANYEATKSCLEGRSGTIPTSHISVTFGSIESTEPTPSATTPGEGSSQGGLVAIILAIIAIIGAAVAFVPGILPR